MIIHKLEILFINAEAGVRSALVSRLGRGGACAWTVYHRAQSEDLTLTQLMPKMMGSLPFGIIVYDVGCEANADLKALIPPWPIEDFYLAASRPPLLILAPRNIRQDIEDVFRSRFDPSPHTALVYAISRVPSDWSSKDEPEEFIRELWAQWLERWKFRLEDSQARNGRLRTTIEQVIRHASRRTQVIAVFHEKDRPMLEEFREQLETPAEAVNVPYWDVTEIKPGTDTEKEIQQAFDQARVVVFFQSAPPAE